MPYIDKSKRVMYDDYIHAFELMHADKATDGELNYLVTGLCHSVIKKQGLKYGTLNKIIGVLTCVIQELYRKIAAPYEEVKLIANGPVSILDTPGQGLTPGVYPGLLMTEYGRCKKCDYRIADGETIVVDKPEILSNGSNIWTCPKCETKQPLVVIKYSSEQAKALQETR
ncbi:MAG: hypothetical protein IMZ53_04915 [Thermoplasmata archaeon]|nr:hypothetical protein [Thermoplasmata archaeon]